MVGVEALTLALAVALGSPGGVADLAALEAAWFAERDPNPPLVLSYAPPPEAGTRGLDAAPAPPVDPAPLEGLTVPVVLNGPVRDFISFFQARGRFIYAGWWARMHRYAAHIRPILEEHGVPPELIYVCMIESGFDPDAVSRAAAVGQWQFVQSTGSAYELRLDPWIDERRDPIKATRAAARHFRDLYDRYGSWPLVLAAYNAGVGHVSRGIKKANTNDFWRLASAGAIPTQATRYVPKAMAAMIIGQDPARYGFGDVKPEPTLDWRSVDVPGGRDLQSLAKAIDVPFKQLAALNPELRRGFTPPDGTDYALRVPPGKAAVLTAHLDKRGRGPGVFVEHTVRFGERLVDIARAYATSRRTLRRLNGLGRGNPPAGQVLIIPKAKGRPPGDPVELLVATDPEVRFDVPGRELVYFPVRQRTDMDRIAAWFRVSPGQLALWNGLDPQAPAQRGMVLRVWVAPDFDRSSAVLVDAQAVVEVAAGSDAAENALAYAKKERKPTVERLRYTVRSGDNLWKIARKFGVTVSALRAENGMGRGDGLSPGKVLKVPRAATPKPRGKAAKRKPKAGAKGRTRYKVRSGDSLWKIARKFGVSVKAIRRANGMGRKSGLRPGQRLVIP